MPDLQESNPEINIKALIDGAITHLEAAKPEMLELDAFKADKAALMRELAALRGEVDAHRTVVHTRQVVLDEMDRKIAHAKDELGVILNDIARARADFEKLRKAR
jgi:hypothetical protein